MVSITLSVPEETKQKMNEFSEINWSGFIRRCIMKKTEELSWKEEMLQKLKAEEKFDKIALELGEKLKERVWERHKKEGW